MDYLPTGWQLVTEFPEKYGTIMSFAGGEGSVYAVGNNFLNVILKYDGKEVIEDFVGPENVNLSDVGFSGRYGFAGGAKGTGGYLTFFNGTKWGEKTLNNKDVIWVTNILSVDEDTCWLIVTQGNNSSSRLGYWDGDSLTVFKGSGPVDAAAYSRETGAIYAWNQAVKELKISFDGGVTWVTEKIKINGENHIVVKYFLYGAAVGEDLYTVSGLYVNGGDFTGVIKRTGEPGAGKYELSFMSWQGPYFNTIEDIAFRDENDGLAVGSYTTLHYNKGDWRLEKTRDVRYKFVAVCGTGGYWALAEPYEGRKQLLLYQP